MPVKKYAVVLVTFELLHLSECVRFPNSVRLGIFRGIFDRDGSLDYGGSYKLASILLAIRDINNSTFILPNTNITFALRGTNHGEYRTAAKTSQDFIDVVFHGKGVNAVVGTGFFESSKAAGQVFSYSGINNVEYGAMNTELSHGDTYPYFRRVCPSDSFDGVILASIAKLKYALSRVNIIFTLDTYGTDTSNRFIEEAHNQNLIIDNQLSFWPGETDFGDIISELKDKGIGKVYVLMMKSADAAQFLMAGYRANLFHVGVQILGTQYVMSSATWKAMSKDSPVSSIMNGVVGVTPYVNRDTSAFRSFLARYLNQPDTRVVNADGSISCDKGVDDDGNTALFIRSDAKECGGVSFSRLPKNGTSLPDYALYAYDAVWALAYALHQQIYVHGKFNYSGADVSHSLVNEVDFDGVTGHVDLFQGYGGSTGFAIGDRQSDLHYKVLNFNPNFFDSHSDSAIRTIGYWTTTDGASESPTYDKFVPCTVENDARCSAAVYHTLNGSPVDGAPDAVEVGLEGWVRTYLQAGVAVCGCFVVWYALVIFAFRETRLIKTAQPGVCFAILVGACLATLLIGIKTLPVTDSTCLLSMWVAHCAFAIIFLALLIKTWRVATIVNSGFSKVKITNRLMYQILSSAFLLFCVILVVDTFIGRPRRSFKESFDGRKNIRLLKCENENPDVTNVLFAIEALVLFYGAKLCYDAQGAPDSVNDSTSISLAIYLIVFVSAVTFPIVFLSIDPTPQNLTIVMASGFIFAVVGVLNILFAYRTSLALDGVDVDQNLNLVRVKDVVSSSSDSKLSKRAHRLSNQIVSSLMRKPPSLINIESSRDGVKSPTRATIKEMPVFKPPSVLLQPGQISPPRDHASHMDSKTDHHAPSPSTFRPGYAVSSIPLPAVTYQDFDI